MDCCSKVANTLFPATLFSVPGVTTQWLYQCVFLKCQLRTEFVSAAFRDLRSLCWAAGLFCCWGCCSCLAWRNLSCANWLILPASEGSVCSFLHSIFSHLLWTGILPVRKTALRVSCSLRNKTWRKIGAQHIFFHSMVTKSSFYSFSMICLSFDSSQGFGSEQGPNVLLCSPWVKAFAVC